MRPAVGGVKESPHTADPTDISLFIIQCIKYCLAILLFLLINTVVHLKYCASVPSSKNSRCGIAKRKFHILMILQSSAVPLGTKSFSDLSGFLNVSNICLCLIVAAVTLTAIGLKGSEGFTLKTECLNTSLPLTRGIRLRRSNTALKVSLHTVCSWRQTSTTDFLQVAIASFHVERLLAAQRNGFTPETITLLFVRVLQVILKGGAERPGTHGNSRLYLCGNSLHTGQPRHQVFLLHDKLKKNKQVGYLYLNSSVSSASYVMAPGRRDHRG